MRYGDSYPADGYYEYTEDGTAYVDGYAYDYSSMEVGGLCILK